MLTKRPFTLILLLIVFYVCLGSIGAVVCQNNDDCREAISWPMMGLACIICLVASFALMYVEGMGHRVMAN